MDRIRFGEVFDAYVSAYDLTDPKIKLKYIHTGKVAENSARIAASLGLCPEDIDLSWEIGMLHDIGRFEQLRRYNTFLDSESIDHAQFGADLLFKEDLIKQFEQDESKYEIIERSIRYHNQLCVPTGVEPGLRMYCDIIRDADKVDIFRANVETSVAVVYNVTEEELTHCAISDEAMAVFLEDRTLPRHVRHTAADHLLGLIALSFELVYPESRHISIEQGYLMQLIQFHSANPETEKKMHLVRERIQSLQKK